MRVGEEGVAPVDQLEKMRGEMDRAWKDFFEKNPFEKEEDILRQVDERMRGVVTGSLRSRLKRNQRRVKTRRGNLQERLS